MKVHKNKRPLVCFALLLGLILGMLAHPAVAVPLGAGTAFNEVLFDDMEHGDPFGNGWFS